MNSHESRVDVCNSYHNADMQKIISTSSDDTSNKRKATADNDISTMSLTQTSKTSPKNSNDLKFSIPLSSLHQLGNFGELSFTVSSNRNKTSRYYNSSHHKSKGKTESRGSVSKYKP